jgi:hypothetical protein
MPGFENIQNKKVLNWRRRGRSKDGAVQWACEIQDPKD